MASEKRVGDIAPQVSWLRAGRRSSCGDAIPCICRDSTASR